MHDAQENETPPADALVERCRKGDRAAFRELYAAYHRKVASQLSHVVPRADLPDVVQEVFVEVFRSVQRFEGRSAFTTWLYRLSFNVAMKHRRQSSRPGQAVQAGEPREEDEMSDPAADPASELLSRERAARAEALLEKLAPKKRAVLVLHDIRGMDAAQIAKTLGSNILTVRTRLFYARREFEKLAQEDPALADYFQTKEAAR